jgi:UDP-2-acetamido-3-amino-2,3-dideoxy-glucuronate N-acetyltransferase
MEYKSHPTAIIDEGASIGKGSTIWHWTHVCGGAIIGVNCSLGQNVYVSNNAIIGNNVKIQNNVSVFDNVTLQDGVFCGPSAVFTNVLNPRANVPRKAEFKNTLVKEGATLGANSTIICGVTIGKYAFVAAGAVITKDVSDFAVMIGVPARQDGWMSEYGERIFFDKDNKFHCKHTGHNYYLERGLCRVEK